MRTSDASPSKHGMRRGHACDVMTTTMCLPMALVDWIMKAAASPVDAPWPWTLAFGHHEDRTPTHGYAATRGGFAMLDAYLIPITSLTSTLGIAAVFLWVYWP
jgi:hypothetical protein